MKEERYNAAMLLMNGHARALVGLVAGMNER
jgi:hypothetical protein